MPNLRLLTYNIRNGGKGREAILRETIDRIQPHIAVLQEVRAPAVIDAIAGGVGEHRLVGGGAFSRSRVAIVSRFPFIEAGRYGPWWAGRRWVDVVVRPFDGLALNVHGIQLFAHQIWPAELQRRREVVRMVRHVQQRAWMPQLIAGDFNTIARGDRVDRAKAPWSIKAQRLSQGGFIPRWSLKPLMQAGYIDCFRTYHPAADGFTVLSNRPSGRIDYIFGSGDIQNLMKAAEVGPASNSGPAPSDHLPVWVDVDWPQE